MNARTLLALGLMSCTVGCGDAEIIVPDVMTIVAILPTHGSADVSTDVEALVYFSHAASNAGTVLEHIGLSCLGGPDASDSCASPSGSCSLSAEPPATVTYDSATQVAKVVPLTQLESNSCFVLVVAAGIESSERNVGPLPVDVRSSFRTRQ